jgi:multiple sugar transport system permease protein
MPRRPSGPLGRLEATWGLLLAGPYILGLLVFVAGPIISTWFMAFLQWDGITAPRWHGMGNFDRLVHDGLFWRALWNTVYFTAASAPLGVALSLMLALLANVPMRGITIFRAACFLPVVTSLVAVSLVWTWFYDPQIGVLNYAIERAFALVGLAPPEPIRWLNDPRTAMPAVIIMSVWKGLGYNMVIFLAALQGVPKSLQEAAVLDGAGPVSRFRHVTLPIISPITFFVVIITTIGGLQVFDQVYVMTRDGRPANSTMTLVYYLYKSGFENLEMGYAATIGAALFLLVMAVTLAQLWGQRRWVHVT